ncbi:hypothetical protein V8C42DRAFT_327283 [Trichoderma barbatum]
MLSASRGDGIEIWDAATVECIQTLEGHLGAARAVAWSPRGQLTSSQDWCRKRRALFLVVVRPARIFITLLSVKPLTTMFGV